MLSVIADLVERLDKVLESDLRRAERGLGPVADGEQILGTIHNEEARKMLAVAMILRAQSDLSEYQAEFKSDSKEEQETYRQESVQWAMLADLAREVWWMQARSDIGGIAWTNNGTTGVRSGWVLVLCRTQDDRLASLLRRLARGGIPGEDEGGREG